MSVHVRRATLEDVPAIAHVLADAFLDNPWTRWTVAADGHADRLLAIHTAFLIELAVPYGCIDIAEFDGTIAAAAVWMDSDAPVPESTWARVHALVTPLHGNRATAADGAENLLAPYRPTTAHTALATIGVARHLQHHGIGTATLLPGLHAADTTGEPLYLETSTHRNLRFYSRHGFTTTAVVDLPDDGPRTWCMQRDPAPHRPQR